MVAAIGPRRSVPLFDIVDTLTIPAGAKIGAKIHDNEKIALHLRDAIGISETCVFSIV
jgi:hypothetical protein